LTDDDYNVRCNNEVVFGMIRNGESLEAIPTSVLKTARLYTGGWSEGKRTIDAELARR